MKKQILTIAVFLFAAWSLNSQSVTPTVLASSGGEGENGSNSVEWTLGEMSIMTLSQGQNSLTQGFHQPNLLIVNVGDQADLGLEIYPNPTQDRLIFNYAGSESLQFHLLDINGRTVTQGDIAPGQTEVGVERIPSGHYIINVLSTDNLIHSYKIEKTGL